MNPASTTTAPAAMTRGGVRLPVPVVVADLDGTIVHSLRRFPDPAGMVVVERYENRDVGIVTAACWSALQELQSAAELIPVTARVRRQYERVLFPATPRIAVIEAGARILVEGTPDAAWDERSTQIVAATGVGPSDVVARMSLLDLAEPGRIGDVALAYVRVASDAGLVEFERWCVGRGWSVVGQDGRIYALPDGIGKAEGAARAVELADGVIVAAAGDGLMDEAMLRLAPFALTPELGPLWESGFRFATPVSGFGPLTSERIVLEALIAVQRHRKLPFDTKAFARDDD